MLSEHTVRFVSSAYIAGHDLSMQFGRSLTYNKNKRGPRFDPWGIPQRIFPVDDVVLFTLQYCSILSMQYIINISCKKMLFWERLEILKFLYINKKRYVSRRWHIPRGRIANRRP
jgi:hypothetical protein